MLCCILVIFQNNMSVYSQMIDTIMCSPHEKKRWAFLGAQFPNALHSIARVQGTFKDWNWGFLVVPGGKNSCNWGPQWEYKEH